MSQQAISFKLDTEQKEEIESFINEYMKIKGIETKGKTLFDIITKFKTFYLTEIQRAKFGSQRLRTVECKFIHKIDTRFYCLENASKRKEAKLLGDDPDKTIIICESCLIGKEIEKQDEQEKLFRKDQMRKILDIRKALIRISREGFNVDCFMCNFKLADDSEIIFSTDGQTLKCPNMKDELVKINEVCRKTIDPKSGGPPCRYLLAMSHIVKVDITKKGKEGKEINTQLKELEFREPIEVESTKLEG